MSDDDAMANEMGRREELIAEKLAEAGVELQAPVSFARHPSGPIIVQMAGVISDPSKMDQTFEEKDEFEAIVAAEREAEKAQKAKETEERAKQAFKDLGRLASDDDDD